MASPLSDETPEATFVGIGNGIRNNRFSNTTFFRFFSPHAWYYIPMMDALPDLTNITDIRYRIGVGNTVMRIKRIDKIIDDYLLTYSPSVPIIPETIK